MRIEVLFFQFTGKIARFESSYSSNSLVRNLNWTLRLP